MEQKANQLIIHRLNLNKKDANGAERQLLKDVTLHIPQGETLGLVGESGSGKSLSSMSILKLLPNGIKANGNILFLDENQQVVDLFGISNKDLSDYRGKKIAMIFQEPMTALNPLMRCGMQIDEVLNRHTALKPSERISHIKSLFEKVKLHETERIYKSFPHQLSGGQRQRVMIAMALACNPDLLIADEPTTALDSFVQKEILILLKEIQREFKMTMLFISHDMDVVSFMSDRIGVMLNGELIEEGPKDEILNYAKHNYTKALMACRPGKSPLRLRELPTVQDFNNTDHDFYIPDPSNVITDLEFVTTRREIMAAKPIIEVKRLYVDYIQGPWWRKTKKRILTNINFEVYPGEILALVGESGSGKSTIARAIVGLTKISDGEILLNVDNNKSSTSGNALSKGKVQMVFQDPFSSLNPNISIADMLYELVIRQKETNTKQLAQIQILKLLRDVGLDEGALKKFPHEFSGGQRQRLCIARALATNPEVLICDESIAALDVSVQAQILNLLRKVIEKYKIACLFITHDWKVVQHLSHRVLVLKNGKTVDYGNTEVVLKNPQDVYTRNLIEAHQYNWA